MGMGRWERIEELFAGAQALDAGERQAYLARECDDAELRAEVAAMLAAEAPLSIERLAPGDPILGAQLGPWRVTAPLARGGMGAVYLAERADGQYAQQAAVKLVS